MWGCLIKVLKLDSKRTRLRPKTVDHMAIGCAQNNVYYVFLVSPDDGNAFKAIIIIKSKNTSSLILFSLRESSLRIIFLNNESTSDIPKGSEVEPRKS